jgi:hypothetical protein
MKTVYGNGRIIIISLILAVLLSGSALATDVQLDLGSAPLYPDDEKVYPGDEVQIPVFLTNYYNGPIIAATSNEITYDSEYLTPLIPALGPAGQTAGKNLRFNITDPGLYILGVLGTTDQNLKTPIPDGIVAYARFMISASAPAGTYILGNKAGCTDPDGNDIPVSGTDGFIEVAGLVSSTTTTEPVTTIPITSSTTTTTEPVTTISTTSTTTTSIATTTVPLTTTTSIEAGACTITINPSAISVVSTETMQFTATAAGTECNNPQLAWSVDSDIGSTIDDDGNYQAGENNTGAEVTDIVLVIDYANNTSATATVSVSALPVGEITLITPKTIYSFRQRARLHLLIIRSDQGAFKNTAELSFSPAGDINPVATMVAGRFMLAFVSVRSNVQGQYDVTIFTDSMIYTKKAGLNVTIAPWFSNNKTK